MNKLINNILKSKMILWKRLLSFIIDIIIYIPFDFMFRYIIHHVYNFNWAIFNLMTAYIYFQIMLVTTFIIFKDSYLTIGYLITNLRVLNIDGTKLHPSQAFIRLMLFFISIWPLYGIGFIIAIFHKDNRCLHDILTRAIVIDISKQSLSWHANLKYGGLNFKERVTILILIGLAIITSIVYLFYFLNN